MKLTRRGMLKVLCVLPLMTLLPEKEAEDSLRADRLFFLGDYVSLDSDGYLIPFKGDGPLFMVRGEKPDGLADIVDVSTFKRWEGP